MALIAAWPPDGPAAVVPFEDDGMAAIARVETLLAGVLGVVAVRDQGNSPDGQARQAARQRAAGFAPSERPPQPKRCGQIGVAAGLMA
jgi:hypothetical protein